MGDMPDPFACLNLHITCWQSSSEAAKLYPTLAQIPSHIPAAFYGMAAMLVDFTSSRFGAMDYDNDTVSIWEHGYPQEKLVLVPKTELREFDLEHALNHLMQAASASHVRSKSLRLATTAWLLWRWFDIQSDAKASSDVTKLYLVKVERPLTDDGRRNERDCGILESHDEADKALAKLKAMVPENTVSFEHVRFFATADDLVKHPYVKGFLNSKLSPPGDWY